LHLWRDRPRTRQLGTVHDGRGSRGPPVARRAQTGQEPTHVTRDQGGSVEAGYELLPKQPSIRPVPGPRSGGIPPWPKATFPSLPARTPALQPRRGWATARSEFWTRPVQVSSSQQLALSLALSCRHQGREDASDRARPAAAHLRRADGSARLPFPPPDSLNKRGGHLSSLTVWSSPQPPPRTRCSRPRPPPPHPREGRRRSQDSSVHSRTSGHGRLPSSSRTRRQAHISCHGIA